MIYYNLNVIKLNQLMLFSLISYISDIWSSFYACVTYSYPCHVLTFSSKIILQNAWEKERNGLMQEVLKEESKRIRGELLLDFTENDNLAHTEKGSEYVDDVYSDVRDFISYMKSVYCKKLHALKEKIEYQSNELKEEQVSMKFYIN